MLNKAGIIKFLTVVFLIFWIGLTETAVANGSSTRGKAAKRFNVGVCTHFSQNKGVVDMNIESMKNAGIGEIRDEATWSSLEREKGKLVMPERYNHYVRRASAAGLDVMLILYEIWNEWDIGIGMRKPYNVGGSPEDYIKLLKAVYPRIKVIEPKATVIVGGCTSGGVRKGWFEKVSLFRTDFRLL